MATVTVGLFGGAFDPPHVGHVELARAGVEHYALQRLLIRVVDEPGHKDVSTAPEIRLLLAELAFAPLDEADVALDPYARTVDSLEALELHDPVFLVGADEFASFLSWKRPERVLEHTRGGRSGVARARAGAARPGRARVAVRDRAAPGLVVRDPCACGRGGADRRARARCGGRGDRPARPLPRG